MLPGGYILVASQDRVSLSMVDAASLSVFFTGFQSFTVNKSGPNPKVYVSCRFICVKMNIYLKTYSHNPVRNPTSTCGETRLVLVLGSLSFLLPQ